MMRTSQRSAGLTLLELLVAVTILAVALVSMLGLHARNIRLSAEVQDMTVAGMLAARLAAEIQASDTPPDVGVATGGFSDDPSRLRFVGAEVYGGDLAARFTWRREVDTAEAIDTLGPFAAFLGELFLPVRIVVGTKERIDLAEVVFVMPRARR